MPGFDGTGPMGLGPLTGRGRGFCPTGIVSVQAIPSQKQTPVYGSIRRRGGFRGGRGRFGWFY